MRKHPRVAVAVVLTALAGSLSAGPAWAQWPQPRLLSVSRPGIQAGESADVTLRGTDLERIDALWFDHPGLRAFHLKGTTFRVVAASGTTIGQHDIRAVGPFGLSNPRTFVIGDRPESVEIEPNNTPDRANALAMNSVVNGEIAPTDVDCFAFEGKRGQRVFLDVAAERIESRLDATLRVLGPDGREIAESRDAEGVDPFLDLTLPADGRYVVRIHDVIFGGSADHVYRLSLGNGPRLDAIVPVVARQGVSTEFLLIGRNLGGTPAPDLTIEGRPLERKTVVLTPPAEGNLGASDSVLGYVPSHAGLRRGFEYQLSLPSGTSNSLFIAEATDPVVVEREPNDSDATAQSVTLPCDISACFGAPNDTDIFRFSARKGDVWWIETTAERLGSPADPTFLVQRVVEKGPPQDIDSGEDSPDLGGGVRFGTASVDASLRWRVPEDGTYQVVVNDLYGSQRGDPRLVYRLNIRPDRPDFRLVVVPETANQIDAVSLGAGGRALAAVLVWRTDGFAGPVRVEARELPAGVRCEPIVIAAGQAAGTLVFEAADDAKPTVGIVRLIGRARFGDRKDEVATLVPGSLTGPAAEHEAIAGGLSWPPLNAAAPTIAPARVTRGFVIAVRERAPLAVSASPAVWTVAQGHQLNLDVAVARREGFVEAVTVTAGDLPAKFVNGTATIAGSTANGPLPLFVDKGVAPGTYSFLLKGTGPYPFNKDANAKTKTNINLTEPSNTVVVTVRPAPVALAVKGGTLKPGGSLDVEVTASRQNGFAEELTLTMVAPTGSKVSAAPVSMGPGQTSAKLVVAAAPDSPAGATVGLFVRALATVRGAAVDVDEPLPLTIAK